MNVFSHVLSSPTVEQLGWTLLHSLWQFALVSMLVMCLLRAMDRASAAVRYVTVSLAMLGVILVPPITFVLSRPVAEVVSPIPVAAVAPAEQAPPRATAPSSPVSLPDTPPEVVAEYEATAPKIVPPQEPSPRIESDPQEQPATGLPLLTIWLDRTTAALRPYLGWIVGGWLLGMLFSLVRPLVACHSVRKLRRQGTSPVEVSLSERMRQLARRLGIRRRVEIVQSSLVQVPAVIGVWRPLILLPASVLSGLTTSELEAIIAHELGHVRRHDYAMNIVQMALESIFFYHPAVWWMSHQMRVLREDCCDDLALSVCGNRAAYARSLVTLEELRGAAAPPAVAANGGSLLARVRRIVSGGHQQSSTMTKGLWQLLPLASVAAVFLMLMLPDANQSEAADAEKSAVRLTLVEAGGQPVEAGTRVNLARIGYTADVAQLPTFVVGKKGRVKLDGLEQGANHLIAKAEHFNVTPLKFDMPADKHDRQLELRRSPAWADNASLPLPKLTVSVHGEGAEQRIQWKFDYSHASADAPQYDLTPYDLQLVSRGEMVRVIPMVGDDYYENRFVRAGDEYSVNFSWIDLMQSGLWSARYEHQPGESAVDAPPGKVQLTASNGEHLYLDAPEKMLQIIEHRRQATAQLEFQKDSFFLGENLLTHYGVTNHSDQPLTIDWGGDYRGSERHLRFKAVAFDSEGKQLADPWPHPMNMGGLGSSPEIAPGETYWMSIPLHRYCNIREPGQYEVKVYHDLGWDSYAMIPPQDENRLPDEGHIAPIATGTITIRQPNERQAQNVLNEMFELPHETWTTGSGEKSEPYAEFRALNFPVYVPLLKQATERASDQEPHPALVALGATPTVEATRALIDLLSDQREEIASKALDQLLKRLPYPYLAERAEWPGHFGHMQQVVEASWRAEFRTELLDYALDVMRHGNAAAHNNNLPDAPQVNRMQAAKILQAVARRSDYDRLRKLEMIVLQATDEYAKQPQQYIAPDELINYWADALWYSLCDGKTSLPGKPQDWKYVSLRLREPEKNMVYPEEAEDYQGRGLDPFSYIRLMQQNPGSFFPQLYPEKVLRQILHRNVWIRAYTLQHMPSPMHDSWYEAINQILPRPAGESPLVAMAAFQVLQRDPDPRCIEAIEQRLKQEGSESIAQAGQAALEACRALKQWQAEAEAEAAKTWAGKVTGRVVYRGDIPAKRLQAKGVKSDAQLTYEIGDKATEVGPEHGLANAVVALRRPGDQAQGYYAEGSKQVLIPELGNYLQPRVVALQQGQTLEFKNEAEETVDLSIFAHNREQVQHFRLEQGEVKRVQPLATRNLAVMKSLRYRLLEGRIFVHTNRYFAVTAADGSFSIENVPAGNWEIDVLHEKCRWIEKFRQPSKCFIEVQSKPLYLELAMETLTREGQSSAGNKRNPKLIATEPNSEPTHVDRWFWPDPYSHLGHVDSAGDGWRYLRLAADPQAARENDIGTARQEKIAQLYRAAQKELTSAQPPSVNKVKVYREYADQARTHLTDQQHTRVMQLLYQRMSYDALEREDVAEAIDLSSLQRQEVDQAIEAHLARLQVRDREIQAAIEALGENGRGAVLAQQVAALKELTDSRGPYGRLSHKQVWLDFHKILSPAQRDLFNKLRGPMPPSAESHLKAFEGKLDLSAEEGS